MKLITTFFLISLIFFVIGCNVDKKDNIVLINMNEEMESHCIGRSFIDLPRGYFLKSGSLGNFIPEKNKIEDEKIDLLIKLVADKVEFEREVNERYLRLSDRAGMTSQLSKVKEIPDVGKLFRIKIIGDDYESEIHWMVGNKYLIATIESYKNQVEKAETILLNFVRDIERQKTDADFPASFCLDGVAISGKFRSEFASLHFASAATPDITFSADIDTYQKDDAETLLQRVGGVNSLLRKFDAKESVLRKGELKAAGMRAQEWGASVLLGEDRKEKQVAFTLETMRPVPGPSAPKIHLEMEVKGSSTQNEAGLLTLWDSVTKSLRQR